jgi:hypothetical protein
MKKAIICGFIFLLFASYNNKEQTQYNNKIVDKKSDLTIEDICYRIFTDLKIKWDYSDLEDLFKEFKGLNISGDYTIRESVVKNTIQTGEGFFHISDIEYGQYKIRVSAFSNYSDHIANPIIYRLNIIEIEISDNNYLDLFPYNSIEEYIEDNNFGEIYKINQGKGSVHYRMRYEQMIKYGDDRFGYSDLVFRDDLLKSIRIIGYTP